MMSTWLNIIDLELWQTTGENWSRVRFGRRSHSESLVLNLLSYQRIGPFHLYKAINVFYKTWDRSSKRELYFRKPETLVCKNFTCELEDWSSNCSPEVGRKWIRGHFSYLLGRYLNHRDMMYSKRALPHVGANGFN